MFPPFDFVEAAVLELGAEVDAGGSRELRAGMLLACVFAHERSAG